MVKFSIVVPVYDEEKNIKLLDDEIRSIMDSMGSYEMIYVNDGSNDKSLGILKSLKDTIIVDLQRNYGQAIALDAGFRQANGDYIITLDADLQNDPHDIPKMYEYMIKNNLDVVAGWRHNRKDKASVRMFTLIGRFLRKMLISDGVHDTGCTLRIYTRNAAKSLDLWGEMHRYILALLRWKGFRIGEIKVNHRSRKHGSSKYGANKTVKGLIDLVYIWFINKYSHRPLHVFGLGAILAFFLGFITMLYMIYLKLFNNISLSDNAWFTVSIFLFLTAIQLFVSGIIVDLLIKIHFNASPIEQRYSVKEIVKKK